jgi:hypothetical protein
MRLWACTVVLDRRRLRIVVSEDSKPERFGQGGPDLRAESGFRSVAGRRDGSRATIVTAVAVRGFGLHHATIRT